MSNKYNTKNFSLLYLYGLKLLEAKRLSTLSKPLVKPSPGFQIFLSISIESASASWKMIWSTLGYPAIKKKCLVIEKLWHLSVTNIQFKKKIC